MKASHHSKYIVRNRSSYPLISLTVAVSAFFLGIVLFLHFWKGIPIGILTRDPNAIAHQPFYNGFLSQIGIFFWSATATVCFFSVGLLSRNANNHKLKNFLLISALLTLLLGLDDVFLLHEVVFPHFGIQQKFVYAGYAAFVLFYLFRFHSLILKTEHVFLTIALFFFGVSAILDFLHPPGIDLYLFEDGAKLIGIVSWLVYFVRVGEYTANLNAHNKVLNITTIPIAFHKDR